MKKAPQTGLPRSGRFWQGVAMLSLALNVVIAVYAWRSTRAGREPVAAVKPMEISAKTPPAASRELRSYAALGSFMAESNRIADLGWSEIQFRAFLDGLRSSYEGKGVPLDDDARQLRTSISERVQSMLEAERPNPIQDYFRTLREKEGVLSTASGLHYRMTEVGSGSTPMPGDTVVISFAARLPDGQALPAFSRARTRTAVRDLLPGLAEGVQLLKEGGKALIYIPPALAFPEESWPSQLPRNIPLTFFLELHEIEAGPTAK